MHYLVELTKGSRQASNIGDEKILLTDAKVATIIKEITNIW